MKSMLPVVAGLAVSVSALPTLGVSRWSGECTTAEATSEVSPKPIASTTPTPDLRTQPTLYVVAYAHLDTQWRWTYVDTIRDYIPSTLVDNFKFFDKYPDYVFNFSGSRRYRMMQEYYPQEYAKLKEYVAQGRWFPCGSSVDENDANVPSGESFIRHVLYGNKFFRREFGIASDEFMLPDCFGFPASMPTLLAHCGLKGFSTQKLTWNAVVPIPFKVGVWEGPDGSSVIAAFDPGAYVGEVRENLANSEKWGKRIEANADKSGVHTDYHYYGTGDIGGAPTERSVAMVEESLLTQGKIKVIADRADRMFHDITPAMKQSLPTYKGELMLTEHSAGSITSQAYMKRWNRKNELLADAAERAAVGAWMFGARSYPSTKLEDAWYLVLGSQMHDILPGTSVPKAYEYSWNDEVIAANQFQQVIVDGVGAIANAMDTTGAGQPLVLFNALSWDREDVVEASIPALAWNPTGSVRVIGPDGVQVPAQVLSVKDGSVRIAFGAKVSGNSLAVYHAQLVAEAAQPSMLRVSERELENERYVVNIDSDGNVASIFDKQQKQELLSRPMQLGLHYENPREWPAWNQDWADRQKPAKSFASATSSARVVERGPARVAIEVTQEAEGSTFVQQIRLSTGDAGNRVEFVQDIDWRSQERSLRVHVPLAIASPRATYDIGAGTISRGNGHEKQFEYSFHKWFNLTDASQKYGVSMMSDSKYGADKPSDDVVRLTLLHTPGTRGGYPDQGTQDIGRHHVQYALQGHAGNWTSSSTPAQAARFNQPIMAFATTSHAGQLGKRFTLASVSDPNVSIGAIKKAEASDEVVVRLREHVGSQADGVVVTFAQGIEAAREVDGQERPIGEAKLINGKLHTSVPAYGLRSFALKLAGGKADGASPLQCTPIALAFDSDVMSTSDAVNDGAMDAQGNSYPGAMVGNRIVSEDVVFELGSSKKGDRNAIACNGQTIVVPQGCDQIVLLAAADGDTTTSLSVGEQSVPWRVQNWKGYIGQWDNRLWNSDGQMHGLVPGFVKPADVAWFSSHHQTIELQRDGKPVGNQGKALYDYCYMFKHVISIPQGVTSITLPVAKNVKVFAATGVNTRSAAKVAPASPLFDTLENHTQDAPMIEAVGSAASDGTFADATLVKIVPNLYWREGAVRYTIDGSEPSVESPVYSEPITLSSSAVVKAAVVQDGGGLGPVSGARIDVRDVTPPRVDRVQPMFETARMRIALSEPVENVTVSQFQIEAVQAAEGTLVPKVEGATLSENKRSVELTLSMPPVTGTKYIVRVAGLKDASPQGNTSVARAHEFMIDGPVYELKALEANARDITIADVPGMPLLAKDPWTLNMFVKMDKQPLNRTVLAGFGSMADQGGKGRYLAKFSGGIHFWSSNRDVPSKTDFDLDRWQMITITFDGSVTRVYKDGVEIAYGLTSLSDDDNVIHILPADPWEKLRHFDGQLRDISIWKSAMTADGVNALLKRDAAR